MNLKRQLQLPAAILICLLFVAPLRGEWTLESSRHISAPGSPVTHIEKAVAGDGQATMHLIVPDPKKCALKVIDDASGDSDLGTAMRAHDCLAGVNGGYFHPNRTPLGLVISDGKTIHSFERAKLLSGVLTVTANRIALTRAAEFQPNPKIGQALQAGPFLVDRGKAVAGLNNTRGAARTVVLADGRGNCALLVCDPVTLAEMAQILANPKIITELKVTRALNLDGGSSTALWVREPPYYKREWKPVRNYLGVILKSL